VASYPAQGTSLESLIASADGALYHAKRKGRDCVMRADWALTGQPAGAVRK
jgi:GGDEF domain-containing protein